MQFIINKLIVEGATRSISRIALLCKLELILAKRFLQTVSPEESKIKNGDVRPFQFLR